MLDITGTVIGVGGTIAGAIFGWGLTCLTTKWRERLKLCFVMISTPDSELIEEELRTKTSLSENGIQVYNTGTKPFFLESFSLYHKGRLLVDCVIKDEKRTILPHECIIYTLSEQESEALQFHCDQDPFESCDVIAYSVDEKKFKSTLAIPLFALRARMKATSNIVRQ